MTNSNLPFLTEPGDFSEVTPYTGPPSEAEQARVAGERSGMLQRAADWLRRLLDVPPDPNVAPDPESRAAVEAELADARGELMTLANSYGVTSFGPGSVPHEAQGVLERIEVAKEALTAIEAHERAFGLRQAVPVDADATVTDPALRAALDALKAAGARRDGARKTLELAREAAGELEAAQGKRLAEGRGLDGAALAKSRETLAAAEQALNVHVEAARVAECNVLDAREAVQYHAEQAVFSRVEQSARRLLPLLAKVRAEWEALDKLRHEAELLLGGRMRGVLLVGTAAQRVGVLQELVKPLETIKA